MQTKQQIQQLLISAGASVNKRLGQHFLIDLNLMRLLIGSAKTSDNDIVLEVGCGTGSLTEGLVEHAGFCLAVEYDRALAEIAKGQLARAKNVEIINTDILQSKHTISRTVIDKLSAARKKHTGRFLLVANLPYNVASPVMMNLVTGRLAADGMYVTVQKQVADRMTAVAGNKDYGILSILLCATGDVKMIRVLKPTVFWPQPKVDSAIVRFVRNKEKVRRIKDIKLFSEVVGLFMGHRRKTLLACSKLAKGKLAKISNPPSREGHSRFGGVPWPEIFERCRINPKQRPEQIPPEDYITIANYVTEFSMG